MSNDSVNATSNKEIDDYTFRCSVQWGLVSILFVQVYILVISILKFTNRRGRLVDILIDLLVGFVAYGSIYEIISKNPIFPTPQSSLWLYISIIASVFLGGITVVINYIILRTGIDKYLQKK
jgi:hypothetical protein